MTERRDIFGSQPAELLAQEQALSTHLLKAASFILSELPRKLTTVPMADKGIEGASGIAPSSDSCSLIQTEFQSRWQIEPHETLNLAGQVLSFLNVPTKRASHLVTELRKSFAKEEPIGSTQG